MFKQISNTVLRTVAACCHRYGKSAVLSMVLGLAIGLGIGNSLKHEPTNQAHFLQYYITAPILREELLLTVSLPVETAFITEGFRLLPPPPPSSPPQPSFAKQNQVVLPVHIPIQQPLVQRAQPVLVAPTVRNRVPQRKLQQVSYFEPKKAAAPQKVQDTVASLERAIYPVSKIPNWGAMRTPAQWDRIYPELSAQDFVDVPAYKLSELTIPLNDLTKDLTTENIAKITAKLFYSTRYFGKYNLDSGEFVGRHPGMDFKLARGTPVGAIAGGTVHAVGTHEALGNFVMILHRLPSTQEEVISIYGHLDSIGVKEGQDVRPGTQIGTVGSTGNSTGPHLHLQVDKRKSPGRHVVYAPDSPVSRDEASQWTIHPIEFIAKW